MQAISSPKEWKEFEKELEQINEQINTVQQTERGVKESTGNSNKKNVQYALVKDIRNRTFVEISNDILKGKPKSEWKKAINDNLQNRVVYVANSAISINSKTRREVSKSRHTNYVEQHKPEVYADKVRATANMDEVLQASTNYVNEKLNHKRKDNIIAFARGKTLLKIMGKGYSAEVIVGITKNDSLVLYDIINFKEEEIIAKFKLPNEKDTASKATSQETRREAPETVSTNNIRNSTPNVNPKTKNNSKNVVGEGKNPKTEQKKAQ